MIYKLKYKESFLNSVNPVSFNERGITFLNMRDLKKFILKYNKELKFYEEEMEAIGYDAITLLKYRTLLKEVERMGKR